ncbi:hypothetical protein FHT72_006347 [Rhizobium sp. BK077]|uniref:hypothetical protein n=1 Tax=unclassified Rhizobium TaxID=2613769 RepID=UPI00160AF8D1|nr:MULTISPECIES: hypothetical protein [unclassified Rhizobium]MBB3302922.1 hypothetical protein [Rhizobium sp. BK112]MBB3371815.1 hypothetical protein [Rhizobium sp. BK077]MBB4182782.1 hypothetical protein [Rhizobium sp. BK109]
MKRVGLVHGTFEPNADWCDPGSVLYETLRNRLHAKQFEIKELHWTARNTFRSRYAGSLILQRKIAGALASSSELYLVSHSHGGNVALKASDAHFAQDVKQIFIGTPFIRVKTKITEVSWFAGLMALPLMSWSIYLIASALDATFGFLIPQADIFFRTYPILQLLAALVAIVLLAPMCVILASMFGSLIWWLLSAIPRLQQNVRDKKIVTLTNTCLPTGHVLCVYTLFDEAYWILKIATALLAVLLAAVWVTAAGAFIFSWLPIYIDFKLAVIKSVFGDFGLRGALTPIPPCRVCRPERSDLLIGMFFFPASAILPLALLISRWIANLFLVRAAFGLFDLPTALSSRISVSRTPFYSSSKVFRKRVALTAPAWSRFRFRHSVLVRDESIAHEVARWILMVSASGRCAT